MKQVPEIQVRMRASVGALVWPARHIHVRVGYENLNFKIFF